MLGNIGPATLILIIIVALLLFGPNKLPELGRAFGRTLREFKKGAKDIMDDEDQPQHKEVNDVNRTDNTAAKNEEQRRLPE